MNPADANENQYGSNTIPTLSGSLVLPAALLASASLREFGDLQTLIEFLTGPSAIQWTERISKILASIGWTAIKLGAGGLFAGIVIYVLADFLSDDSSMETIKAYFSNTSIASVLAQVRVVQAKVRELDAVIGKIIVALEALCPAVEGYN